MCGIYGFFNFGHCRLATKEELSAMGATMRHRGPDESGSHVDRGVGLGAARLSIIDLERGRQPIAIADGRIGPVTRRLSELFKALTETDGFPIL